MVAVIAVVPLHVIAGWRISLFKNVNDLASDLSRFMLHDTVLREFEHGVLLVAYGNSPLSLRQPMTNKRTNNIINLSQFYA
jgi:hypothetical protein